MSAWLPGEYRPPRGIEGFKDVHTWNSQSAYVGMEGQFIKPPQLGERWAQALAERHGMKRIEP